MRGPGPRPAEEEVLLAAGEKGDRAFGAGGWPSAGEGGGGDLGGEDEGEDEDEVEVEGEGEGGGAVAEAASTGQRHSRRLRRQPLHRGFSSLHFFLRRRQVKQPVLLRTMGMTRIAGEASRRWRWEEVELKRGEGNL